MSHTVPNHSGSCIWLVLLIGLLVILCLQSFFSFIFKCLSSSGSLLCDVCVCFVTHDYAMLFKLYSGPVFGAAHHVLALCYNIIPALFP